MMDVKFTIVTLALLTNFIVYATIADDDCDETLTSHSANLLQHQSNSVHSSFDQLKQNVDRYVHHKDDSVISHHQNFRFPIVPEISKSSSVQHESSAKHEVLRGDVNKETEFVPAAVPASSCCNSIVVHCCVAPVNKPASAIDQSSYHSSRYESEQRNYTQVQPSVVPTIQRNDFTYGVIDFNSNNQNYHQSNQINDVHSIISDRVPARIVQVENHYVSPSQGSSVKEHSQSYQKEERYNAVPIVHEVPIVRTYHVPVARISNVAVRVQPDVESYHKQESHSSQSESKTISSSNNVQPAVAVVEKYYHQVPIVPESTKYISTGNTYQSSAYEIPASVPVAVPSPYSKSETHEHQSSSSSSSKNYGGYSSPILLRGVPQVVPVSNQQYSSGGSSSSYYSSSNSNSQYKQSASDSLDSGSALYNRIANLNQNTGVRCVEECIPASSAPVKTSYGVSTSFSRSASDINGHKTENRDASVTVNDNGKIDTYNAHS